MTDLADFLLARIAEDEAVAEAVPDNPTVRTSDPAVSAYLGVWHPDRVLAECDAKRRIVEAEPERWVPQEGAPAGTVDMGTPQGMVRVYGKLLTEEEFRDRYLELAPPSQALLFLALPYAGHPDYSEEWRA